MKKKILIVDDFENTLFVTGFTLEQAGYSVLKAASAKEALKIIKTNHDIELLITDYNMPEMNGMQLTKEVRSTFSQRVLPIFVLSTESKEEIQKAAIAAGVTLWIRKPFKSEKLIEYVKRTIGV